MADDIVTRLRRSLEMSVTRRAVIIEAADEIERLRAAGDALATRLRWWTDDTDASYPDHQALRTWEEAHRG